MKKILPLILVVVLVLGSFSYAFGVSDISGEDCEEAVSTLIALGIVNGYTDGTYKPTKVVSRAEMAKMLIIALGYEGATAGFSSNFPDVKGHWAETQGYIGLAAGLGIIEGFTDGTFRPDKTVTYDQALTMVLRALGYNDASLTGSWPLNYKIKALSLNITENVPIGNDGADRGGVGILIYNALTVELVNADKDGDITYKGKTLLDKVGNSDVVTIKPADISGSTALESEIDLVPYLFQEVTLYENSKGVVVGAIPTGETKTLVGEVIDESPLTIENSKGKEIEIPSSLSSSDIYYNGAKTGLDISELNFDNAEVTVVCDGQVDEDNVIGLIIESPEDPVIVQNEYNAKEGDSDVDELDCTTDITLPTKDSDNDGKDELDKDNLRVVGDAYSIGSIKEGDVVYSYTSTDNSVVKLEVVRDTVVGMITEMKSSSIVIKGKEYDYADGVTKLSNSALGNEYKLILDKNGDIFGYEFGSQLVSGDVNYAVLIDSADGTVKVEWGDIAIDENPKLLILKPNGKQEIVEAYWDYNDSSSTCDFVDAGSGKWYSLDTGELYKYELNSKDQIVSLKLATESSDYDREYFSEAEVNGLVFEGNYLITSNTTIFDITSNSEDDWTVISKNGLGSMNKVEIFVDSDTDEIAYMVIEDNITSGGTPIELTGLIIDKSFVLEDGEAVEKVTLYIDGKEKTYFTDDSGVVSDSDINGFFELEIVNEKLSDISAVSPDEVGIITKVVTSNKLLEIDDKYYPTENDASIYVYDSDDDTYTIGDFNDVDVDQIGTLYDLDNNDKIDVIIVTE